MKQQGGKLKQQKRELKLHSTLLFQRGIDGIRTSDTRIFSPLLYQLSYDAIALLFADAKLELKSDSTKFFSLFSPFGEMQVYESAD